MQSRSKKVRLRRCSLVVGICYIIFSCIYSLGEPCQNVLCGGMDILRYILRISVLLSCVFFGVEWEQIVPIRT